MKVFLEGYQAIFPLYEEEIFWLGQMICLRLCLSVTMSAWRKTIFPSNTYLTISEKSTWELLDYLKKLDTDDWYKCWIQNAK
jgi:Ser/Thr protein kinase RdoA (MazF antagonist)